MFIVRIISEGQEKIDYKAFEHKSGAQERIDAARLQTLDGEFESAALFEVRDANSIYDAIEAVKEGSSVRVQLLDFVESRDITIERLIKRIGIEL